MAQTLFAMASESGAWWKKIWATAIQKVEYTTTALQFATLLSRGFMSVSIVPASDFQLPEPEIISHQTDLTMRRTEVRAFSEAQMRAAYAAGIEAGQATTKPRKSRATKADALRPSDVPEGTWTDFIALRKAKGAPLTETALKLIVKDAEKAGYTLTAALEICCARGWQAFRADWVAPRPSARGGSLAGMNYGDRHGDFNQ